LYMENGLIQTSNYSSKELSTTEFKSVTIDLSNALKKNPTDKVYLSHISTWLLLSNIQKIENTTNYSKGLIGSELHTRVHKPIFCFVAAILGFSALLIGNANRFGFSKQITMALLVIVLMKVIESYTIKLSINNFELWPLIYLPSTIGIFSSIFFLNISASKYQKKFTALK